MTRISSASTGISTQASRSYFPTFADAHAVIEMVIPITDSALSALFTYFPLVFLL
jgi:hypothetical protein